jgi:hypothetical protein
MEGVQQSWERSLEITTGLASPEASTIDQAFLQLPKGAVQGVEGESVEAVEAVGEDPWWDSDLRVNDQHQFSPGEDDS